MGKGLESRLQALEKSKQAQQVLGFRCFTQSLTDPAVYHEGALSMGLSREPYSRAQIAELSAEGWQVTVLEWVQGLLPDPAEQRVVLAWE